MYPHLRIFTARFRILIAITARIKLKLLPLGMRSLVERKTVGIHLQLVELQKGQLLTVTRPRKSSAKTKLLLIHPIGHPVNERIARAIAGHRRLRTKAQILNKEIVVADKSHLVTIGRKGSCLLRPLLRQRFNFLTGNIYHIIIGPERTSVNRRLVHISKDLIFLLTQFIILNFLNRGRL